MRIDSFGLKNWIMTLHIMGVVLSSFVGTEDGFGIYKLFRDGMVLGAGICLKLGYVNVGNWLLSNGHSSVDSSIYSDLILKYQINEIEVLMVHGIVPDEYTITYECRTKNIELIRLMIKYGIKLPQSIMDYFTIDGMIDIGIFELLIQNNIFPESYSYSMLHPEYVNILNKYGVYAYGSIDFITEFINNIDVFRDIVGHGILPSNNLLLGAIIIDDVNMGQILEILLGTEFYNIYPDFITYIPDLVIKYRRSLDIIDWCALRGILPSIQAVDGVLKDIGSDRGSYRILTWCMSHGVYPSIEAINSAAMRTNSGEIMNILSLFGRI